MSALPLFAQGARTVRLAGETDLAGFRAQARALLAAGVAPDAVHWVVGAEAGDLLAEAEEVTPAPAPSASDSAAAPRVSVPASFLTLCESVVLHADPARFALLYRLLWRMQREPGLRHDPLDADVITAGRMAKAVRREMHKMRAFVRFRPLAQAASEDAAITSQTLHNAAHATAHVAWFEPEHHIVAANAPFFSRRFANLRWAIFTPRVCVRWEPTTGKGAGTLHFGPGARKEDAPAADAGEALWLTYYAHIFNPARLKLAMMQKEMPRKYWRNLPEAELISPLTAQAAARTGGMVESAPTPQRRGMRLIEPVREGAVTPAGTEGDARSRAPVIPIVPMHGDLAADPDGAITSLAELRVAVEQCRACPIGAHATQAVCGEGPLAPGLMFVGEQPGDREDLQGRPFVGPAGQLFDRALEELGLPRESVYLANAVKHFKFELRGKRRLHKTAGQQEAAACLHWLEHEIALVQPRALVALGATAARSLMGRAVAVTRERGTWLTRADGRRVFITLHPSALLRMERGDFDAAYAQWVGDLRSAMMVQ